MPVALHNIRELLLPGLQAMAQSYSQTKEQWERALVAEIFNDKAMLATKPFDPPFTLDQIHEAEAICENLAANRSLPTTTPNGSANA